MAKKSKKTSSQLPLICEECSGGPIVVTQRGKRVVIRCESCGIASIALMLEPVQIADDIALQDIEIELLSQMSEPAQRLYYFVRKQAEVTSGSSRYVVRSVVGIAEPFSEKFLMQLQKARHLQPSANTSGELAEFC